MRESGTQLAGMIHAELEDAQRDLARQAGEAQRHAPMVVEAAFIGIGLGLGGERQAKRFLAAGLADAAGDTHEARPAARPAGETQPGQPGERILHRQQRRIGGECLRPAMDEGGDRPSLQRRGDIVMSVEARALECDEELAGLDAAAVDGDSHGLPFGGPGEAPAGGGDGFGGRPGDAHRTASAAARASALSSKGWVQPAMVWPVSWPLPAMTSRS